MNILELFQNNKKIIFLMVLAQILAIFFSVGHFHPDEHFQILEFLNYKLYNSSPNDLPWEYHAKMRSWAIPWVFYIISKILIFFKIISPFIHVYFFKFLTALLGLGAVISLAKNFKFSLPQFIPCLILVWFLPFLNVRTSSEAISASLIIIGIGASIQNIENKKFIFSGIILGITFVIRFHTIFIIAPYILHQLVFRKNFKNILFFSLGFLLTYIAGILIDFWGQGELFWGHWNYVYQNIFLGKSHNYGISPWWSYFYDIGKKGIFPFGFIYIFSTLYFWIKNPKDILTWATLPFFIIHTLIAHKELRFLFPLSYFLPIFIHHLQQSYKVFPPLLGLLKKMAIVLIFLSAIKSVHPSFAFYQYLSKQNFKDLKFKGDENPFFIHQLKVNYFNRDKKKAGPFDAQDLVHKKNDLFIFVSKYKDLEFLQKNQCTNLYSEIPLIFIKELSALPFPFISKQMARSKTWALFHCHSL